MFLRRAVSSNLCWALHGDLPLTTAGHKGEQQPPRHTGSTDDSRGRGGEGQVEGWFNREGVTSIDQGGRRQACGFSPAGRYSLGTGSRQLVSLSADIAAGQDVLQVGHKWWRMCSDM